MAIDAIRRQKITKPAPVEVLQEPEPEPTYVILGMGAHARMMQDWLESSVLVDGLTYTPQPNDVLFLGVGDNHLRWKMKQRLNGFVTLDLGFVSDSAILGDGLFIGVNSVIHNFAKIGDACIINTSAVVEHNCILGNAVHIAPGAVLCGQVEVGDFTLVGANAVVLPNVKIGKNCVIGAGTVVTKDVPDNTKVYNRLEQVVESVSTSFHSSSSAQ